EELLNVLAKYPGVRVAARTSSFQFKGQNQDIGEIARMLKVRNVLEGSVRKSGNKLRITAQLIQADTGYHLWSETYDRELDDVFAIQDEISAAIGEALRVELALSGGAESTAPRVAESANTAAYEAFLRGRHLVNQRGRSNINQAAEELKRAVRLDPDFAPAQAWMAIAWTMMLDSPSTYGDLSLAEVKERATPHIERALQLNPNLAEAYGAKTMLDLNSSNYEQAMQSSARALELNPVYIDAMNWRQIAATNFGDYATANQIQRQMLEVDPLTIVGRLNFAQVLAISDLEAGREMALSLAEQNPWASHTALGQVEFYQGDGLAAALEQFMRAYGEDPHDELSNRALIFILSQAGLFDEARRISDGNMQIVDIAENQLESAIQLLERNHSADPENVAHMVDLADALHLAGRFEDSQRYYAQLRSLSPVDTVFDTYYASTISTVRTAYAYKLAGDLAAAEKALANHRLDIEKREKLGLVYFTDDLAEAMASSVEEDAPAVFEHLRQAMAKGSRDEIIFREPAFQSLQAHPEFLSLKAEMHQLVMQEQAKILSLICHNNPIPDIWQPLSSTCMGVQAGP
ncbi:MAG TPA: tetratricopeptide repeat protein, partial [Xanthomonadales bacterium]|nr:tetratricopeptide repeat protein [Xanthomonadales bacterium]